jgi:hypothetical protein
MARPLLQDAKTDVAQTLVVLLSFRRRQERRLLYGRKAGEKTPDHGLVMMVRAPAVFKRMVCPKAP